MKDQNITCYCTKPWNCESNRDGFCAFYEMPCNTICIATGGGTPMTNRDASAALGCALQWNGSGQYDHDAAKEAVRVAQSALEKIPKMEDQIRELTKMIQQLERERDAAVEDMNHIVRANDCVVCDFCAAKVPEECSEYRCDNASFKWRGIQEERL